MFSLVYLHLCPIYHGITYHAPEETDRASMDQEHLPRTKLKSCSDNDELILEYQDVMLCFGHCSCGSGGCAAADDDEVNVTGDPIGMEGGL